MLRIVFLNISLSDRVIPKVRTQDKEEWSNEEYSCRSDKMNSDNGSEDDVEHIPLAQKVVDSDLIIVGTIFRSELGTFSLLVQSVLKGAFSEAIFEIQDKELDNGCYEEALSAYMNSGDLAIIFLTQKENTCLIEYAWNVIRYKNKGDCSKDVNVILQDLKTGQKKPKREPVEAQEITSAIVSALIEERNSLLQGGILTRKKQSGLQRLT